MTDIRNRVTGFRMVCASEIEDNPFNWREHDQTQIDEMNRILDSIGFAGAVLTYTKPDGKLALIDGHMRRGIAADSEVPVLTTDLNESEALALLETFDPVGAMARRNEAKIQALKNELERRRQEAETRLQDSREQVASDPVDEDADNVPKQTQVSVTDTVFKSDNEYGVPLLDPALQAEFLTTPVTKWGSVNRTALMKGTYHFYTDDYKFEAVWKNPKNLISSKCVAMVEPNYSTHARTPKAVALWGIYRKRWIARFAQAYKIAVWVDLNVEREFFDIALLGVPKEWTAYANRAYHDDLAHLDAAYQLACEHSEREIRYLVIGGRDKAQAYCVERGWVWVPEDSALSRHEY